MVATSRPPTLTSKARGTYRDDHGTPEWILDLHRSIHGAVINLDLASNLEANDRVRARRFYSANDPCPDKPTVYPGDVVWCNPPGPSSEVVRFWDIWCGCVDRGADGSFLAFSVDHVRMLSRPPVICRVGFLRQRPTYVGNKQTATIGAALISTKPLVPWPGVELAGPWMMWGGADS